MSTSICILQAAKTGIESEFDESKRALEGDADTEIDDLKVTIGELMFILFHLLCLLHLSVLMAFFRTSRGCIHTVRVNSRDSQRNPAFIIFLILYSSYHQNHFTLCPANVRPQNVDREGNRAKVRGGKRHSQAALSRSERGD